MIIGKTFKGRNLGPDVENNFDYRGKRLGDKANLAIEYLKSLIENMDAGKKPVFPKLEGFVLR